MKQMKQLFLVMMALVLVLSCSACGTKATENPTPQQKAEEQDNAAVKSNDAENQTLDGSAEVKTDASVDTDKDNDTAKADNAGNKTSGSGTEGKTNTATNTGKSKTDSGKTNSVTPSESSNAKSNGLKWEEFYALSGAEKDAYKDSFESMDAFYDWMVDAQAQFSAEHPDIEIGPGGSIDLSKLK